MNACLCPVCGSSLSMVQDVKFVPNEKMIVGRGRVARFTPSEWQILNYLVEKNGALVKVEDMHAYLYQLDPNGGPEMIIISVYLTRIRKKISGLGLIIENIWGQGYRLVKVQK